MNIYGEPFKVVHKSPQLLVYHSVDWAAADGAVSVTVFCLITGFLSWKVIWSH